MRFFLANQRGVAPNPSDWPQTTKNCQINPAKNEAVPYRRQQHPEVQNPKSSKIQPAQQTSSQKSFSNKNGRFSYIPLEPRSKTVAIHTIITQQQKSNTARKIWNFGNA
mmetsp:Transcript_4257/g.7541  ORF Transcript_4257/g.7541 Transcript_4257/m.7541 type:complete len:109 (-) Transcript_4257:31-357(-)